MTKARAPLSIEDAIKLVTGYLGDAATEAATGHKPPVIRNMHDPDHVRQISMRDAIALDVAYSHAGGAGFPFLQCFEHQLQIDSAAAAFDARAVAEQAAIAAKEQGEATGAVIRAIAPGASFADRVVAIREIGQSIAAEQTILASLKQSTPEPRESG